jgi:hypothetical protein
MNAPVVTQTTWAVVARPPGQPKQSQFGGTDAPVTVQINNESGLVYVPIGEGLENLQPGDHFVVEWRAGKWRCCKTQPPELMQTLRSRSVMPPPINVGAPPPPMNTAPPPMSGGIPPRVGAQPPPIPNNVPPDVGEWLEIYQALVSVGVSDAVAASNCIFTNRRSQQKSHPSMN